MLQGLQSLREAVADGVNDLRQQAAAEAADAKQAHAVGCPAWRGTLTLDRGMIHIVTALQGKHLAKRAGTRARRKDRSPQKPAPSLAAWDVGGFDVEQAADSDHATSSSSDSDGEDKGAASARAAAMASTRQALGTLKEAVARRPPAATAGAAAKAGGVDGNGNATDAAQPVEASTNSGMGADASSQAAETRDSGAEDVADQEVTRDPVGLEDGNNADDGLDGWHESPSSGLEPGSAGPVTEVDVRALVTALEQQLRDLEVQVATQTAALAESRSKRRLTEGAVDQARQQLALSQDQCSKLTEQLDTAGQQLVAGEAKVAELRSAATDAKRRHGEELEAVVVAHRAAMAALQLELDEARGEVREHDARARAADAAAGVAGTAVETARGKIATLEQQNKDLELELGAAQRAQHEAEQLCQNALAEAETERAARAEVEGRCEQMRLEAERRARSFQDALQAALASHVGNWEAEEERLRARVHELSAAEAAARRDARELQARLQSARDDAGAELSELREESAARQSALEVRAVAAERALAAATAEAKALARRAEAAESDTQEAREQAEQTAEEARVKRQVLAQTHAVELGNVETALVEARLGREAAQQRTTAVEAALLEAEAKAAESRARVEELSAELEAARESPLAVQAVQPRALDPDPGLAGLGLEGSGLDRLIRQQEQDAGRQGGARGLTRAGRARALAAKSRLSPREWIVVLYVAALHVAYLAALHRGSAPCIAEDRASLP